MWYQMVFWNAIAKLANERSTMIRKWLAVGGLLVLGFGIAGCPAFILGSVVGSLGYAGYEYANVSAAPRATPQAQPSAQPTLSLNDIE
jgi:hypothetical protein